LIASTGCDVKQHFGSLLPIKSFLSISNHILILIMIDAFAMIVTHLVVIKMSMSEEILVKNASCLLASLD